MSNMRGSLVSHLGLTLLFGSAAIVRAQYPIVEQPYRLALSPVLDGVLAEEEWEPFSENSTLESYVQWEPGQLHWAAILGEDDDLVLSLDAGANGWLQGADNYEFRISVEDDGEVSFGARLLDATTASGPFWRSIELEPETFSIVPARAGDGEWLVEATWKPDQDLGFDLNRQMGLRVEALRAGTATPQFEPRDLTQITLVFDVGADIPEQFAWEPSHRLRVIPAGDPFTGIYQIRRSDDSELDRLRFRVEGFAGPETAETRIPAPEFEGRDAVTFEYQTPVERSALPGYRIARLEATTPTGETMVMRSSFKIAELVEFDIGLPNEIQVSDLPQKVTGVVYLQSNGQGSLRGNFKLIGPPGWNVVRGADDAFRIYRARGRSRVGLEFLVPGGVEGVFPLVFRAEIGDRVVERVVPFRITAP